MVSDRYKVVFIWCNRRDYKLRHRIRSNRMQEGKGQAQGTVTQQAKEQKKITRLKYRQRKMMHLEDMKAVEQHMMQALGSNFTTSQTMRIMKGIRIGDLAGIIPTQGKLGIRTHKAYYMAGEVVTGEITAHIKEPIKCDSLVLKATGVEKVEMKMTSLQSENVGNSPQVAHFGGREYTEKHVFFKEKIMILDTKGMIQPGEYVFNFSYQLPSDIPSVFSSKPSRSENSAMQSHNTNSSANDYEAEVVYKMKACLDVGGVLFKDLKAKQHVVVHTGQTRVEPVYGENSGVVLRCFCISQGQATVKVWLNKDSYIAGETAQIKAEIQNNSSSDIGHMRVKLMRNLHLQVKSHDQGAELHGRHYVHVADESEHPGVPAGESKTMELPLKLSKDLQPSVSGKYIQCKYQLEVECDIAMAPDIEVHLPTKIYATIPESWGAH